MKILQKKNIVLEILAMVVMYSLCGAVSFDGTVQVQYFSHSIVIPDATQIKGYVRFNDGFEVAAGDYISCDMITPVNGDVNLHETGTLRLGGDLFLASGGAFSQGGRIDGQDHTLFLQGDLTIPAGKTLEFTSNTTIDGQGHTIILETERGAQGCGRLLISGDPGTKVVFKNVQIKGLADSYGERSGIQFYSSAESKSVLRSLVLDHSTLFLRDTFTFAGGVLEIHNDTVIRGGKKFIFAACHDCIIAQQAMLTLDIDVNFFYEPGDGLADHIKFIDDSSVLFCNGCVLETPTFQALLLTKGHVIVDHRVFIRCNGAEWSRFGVAFGNGKKADNIFIDIMPGANLEIEDGILNYHNIDESSFV